MNTEDTLTKIRQHLKTLKLPGIQKVLEKELAEAAQKALPPTELLERLLAREANALIERRVERKIRESRLPDRKLLFRTSTLRSKVTWIRLRCWRLQRWTS
jgi:DNA replication protein DnaC